jgi:hypothetical protein
MEPQKRCGVKTLSQPLRLALGAITFEAGFLRSMTAVFAPALSTAIHGVAPTARVPQHTDEHLFFFRSLLGETIVTLADDNAMRTGHLLLLHCTKVKMDLHTVLLFVPVLDRMHHTLDFVPNGLQGARVHHPLSYKCFQAFKRNLVPWHSSSSSSPTRYSAISLTKT